MDCIFAHRVRFYFFREAIIITIVFNGKKTDVLEGTTILDFVTAQQLNPKTIVAELNFEIIKEAEWGSMVLKENDTLEVLNFVGGG